MKPEALFGLESATWPALLVSAEAAILASNAAAKTFFWSGAGWKCAAAGRDLAGGKRLCRCGFFFLIWGSSPTVSTDLKFRAATGSLKNFATIIAPCAGEGGDHFLLQLFSPEEIPLPAVKFTPKPPPAPVAPPPSLPTGVAGTGDAALKQKLDCVLQTGADGFVGF